MPVAVVFLLRAVVLIMLWGFVIATVVAVRHDVFGTRPKRSAQTVPPVVAVRPPAPAPPVPAPASTPAPPPATGRRGRPPKPPTAVAAARLAVVGGPSAGASVALSSLPVTIGRSPECGIVLNDDYVSHHHAQLVPRGQEWLITDTGSTNGTFVGDVRVTAPVVVPVGGQIRIGHHVLELRA